MNSLTRIERVTLSLMLNGWTYRVVGEWLGESENVIASRVRSVREKTRTMTTAGLLRKAQESGWLSDLD